MPLFVSPDDMITRLIIALFRGQTAQNVTHAKSISCPNFREQIFSQISLAAHTPRDKDPLSEDERDKILSYFKQGISPY
jgi:hypothetical protein